MNLEFNINIPDIDLDIPISENGFVSRYIKNKVAKELPASASTHTKIVLFETLGGKKIVIHGSANLRSSSNIEQFTIEENKSLYDFHLAYHMHIIEKYRTINKEVKKHKSLRGEQLWQTVVQEVGAGQE